MHSRQILLFWLGICIREGSIEAFRRFVLSSYRMVSGDDDLNFSDEIRASLLTFTDDKSGVVRPPNVRPPNVPSRVAECPRSRMLAEQDAAMPADFAQLTVQTVAPWLNEGGRTQHPFTSSICRWQAD